MHGCASSASRARGVDDDSELPRRVAALATLIRPHVASVVLASAIAIIACNL
jgi:hypothetical protein